MREFLLTYYFPLALVVCSTQVVGGCAAQVPVQRMAVQSAGPHASLKTFLQEYVGGPPSDDQKSTRYFTALVDLNNDGIQEAIVYLTGNGWCGSGGCTTLVLVHDRGPWSVVTRIMITRPPIMILNHSSNGWRDLGVWIQGGGIQPGYEAVLRFNGRTYPTSSANPHVMRMAIKAAGKVIISRSDEGELLYP